MGIECMSDPFIQFALNELIHKHGCHSVIIYGSRSRNDFTIESDYDLIGIKKDGVKFRDARLIEGKYLDAFVYPESDVSGKEEELLRIRNGIALQEVGSFASKLLEKVNQIYLRGPKPMSDDEIQAIRAWIPKMIERSSKNDLEGNYRRTWLQFDLLQNYFELRKKWYLGPKESFLWLAQNDPITYSIYDEVLRNNSDMNNLRKLAKRILDT